MKFGFDHAHAPALVKTHRVDDVELTYNSETNQGVSATLFGSPFFTRTAVDVTALCAQDSYVLNRLTLTAGGRWERLEGDLPEQESPVSRYFPSMQRASSEQRDVVNWRTFGPRVSAAYDLFGDAKTALKGSYGRYYYVLSTGGTPLDNVNPNANYSEQYTWTALALCARFAPTADDSVRQQGRGPRRGRLQRVQQQRHLGRQPPQRPGHSAPGRGPRCHHQYGAAAPAAARRTRPRNVRMSAAFRL